MPGVFQPEAHFAAQCAAPRSGTDPFTRQTYPDVQGTATDENNWLRSWSNDLYLWYSEVPDLDPSKYATADYFPLLKTSASDAQGQPKDKFHFTYTTSAWEALSINDANIGYGVQFFVLQATPPRQVVVAYTQPGSPAVAAPANLVRGAAILTVDGVDVVNGDTQADVDTINAGLSPGAAGESHQFGVQDPGGSTPRAPSPSRRPTSPTCRCRTSRSSAARTSATCCSTTSWRPRKGRWWTPSTRSRRTTSPTWCSISATTAAASSTSPASWPT